jgi:hypothetical protein
MGKMHIRPCCSEGKDVHLAKSDVILMGKMHIRPCCSEGKDVHLAKCDVGLMGKMHIMPKHRSNMVRNSLMIMKTSYNL